MMPEYQPQLEGADPTGIRVYPENCASFGSSADAYKSGLDDMIKRTVFGTKHKK